MKQMIVFLWLLWYIWCRGINAAETALLVQRYVWQQGILYDKAQIDATGLQNENDPTSNVYSILGRDCSVFDGYKGVDGKYTFKLDWIQGQSATDDFRVVWKQSSCPQTDDVIAGYEEISIPLNNANGGCDVFKGLGLSDYVTESYLDGNAGEGCWYNSICPFSEWGGSYPGFNGVAAKANDFWVLPPDESINSGLVPNEADGQSLNIDCGGTDLIQIIEASYGVNCNGGLFNNQLRNLQIACDDKTSCSYTVDAGIIGDPDGGCSKTYTYKYMCIQYATSRLIDVRQCLLDPTKLAALYDGSSIDLSANKWYDLSGNNNDGQILIATGIQKTTETVGTNELYANGHSVLSGTAGQTQISFGTPTFMAPEHTVFNLCKYRNTAAHRGRILINTAYNGLYGFHGGGTGKYFDNYWNGYPETADENARASGDKSWALNSCIGPTSSSPPFYRINGIDGTYGNPPAITLRASSFGIYYGQYAGELSDWACAEIIVVNQQLSLAEVECVEEYFDCKYELGLGLSVNNNCNVVNPSNLPIDCQVSSWQNEGDCSELCGPNGLQRQERTILIENINGGDRGECDNLVQHFECNRDNLCGNGCVWGAVPPMYGIEGITAIISGDPHTREFNGNWHDFQGTSNDEIYYYMHPCRKDAYGNFIRRRDMPFALLGKHESVHPDPLVITVRGLDYIVFELFDSDGKEYYVWLSSSLHSYSEKTGDIVSAFYDNNDPNTRINLVSNANIPIQIGDTGRFKITYYEISPGASIKVILLIDGNCDVHLTMSRQWSIRGRPMHYLEVQPPQCYKCYTCGLFGDFFDNLGRRDRMQTCGGGNIPAQRNYATNYEWRALTWKKSFVDDYCRSWRLRRRLQDEPDEEFIDPIAGIEGIEIQPMVDPEIEDRILEPLDLCTGEIRTNIETSCNIGTISNQDCCNNIGGDYCNLLEEDCIFDICAIAVAENNNIDLAIIDEMATNIFEDKLTEKCADAESLAVEVNAAQNLEPAEGIKIDCIMTDWEYGECSKRYCGGGTKLGIREIDINPENDGNECPTDLEQTIDCNVNECCPNDISSRSFNWDTLTEDGTKIPYSDVTKFEVDTADLSLNINVELQYLGKVYGDDEKAANFPVTYVLDFESYDAHKNVINEPGTCQNREASSFTGAHITDFNDFWTYSEEPQNDDQIGTISFLAYPPPPSNKWKMYMKDDGCDIIVYEGHFTWQELRDCTAFGGGDSYTAVINDDNWLNLTGTLYINIVSPFWYGSQDTHFYRVYQLVSQPFVIAVSSTVYVLGSTGINLMTMSIIAVYKQDENDIADFKLVVLTETAEYMKLIRDGVDVFVFNKADTNNNNLDETHFSLPGSSENTDCLTNKDYLCSQLWEIKAINIGCNPGVLGTDFSGTYSLGFNADCIDKTTEPENNYCLKWLDEHPNIKDNTIKLSAPLVWHDNICNPKIFTIQLSSEMFFYALQNVNFDVYAAENKVDTKSYLYKVGTDRIYVEIKTDFPDNTLDVLNTEIVNVWICTFAPDIIPKKDLGTNLNHGLNPESQTFGCLDPEHDGEYDGNFHHIFSTSSEISKSHGFKEEKITEDSDFERFSFIVPYEVARDTLYVHVQIEVELQESTTGRRRRSLLNVNTANKIQHFGDQIGINHDDEKQPKNPPPPKQPYNNYINKPQQPLSNPLSPIIPSTSSVLSLSSPWIIIIACLLASILIINIGFMFYINCCKQRGRGTTTRGQRYVSVKNNDSNDDSQYFDESEINAINVISE